MRTWVCDLLVSLGFFMLTDNVTPKTLLCQWLVDSELQSLYRTIMLKLDGWWCTNATTKDLPACRTWNDSVTTVCRRCSGSRTPEEGLSRDELFRIIAAMVSERNAALDTATRTQERISAFVEVARCAKALFEAEQKRDDMLEAGTYPDEARFVQMAHATLAIAVQRLELGPEGTSMLTPPTGTP